MKVLLSYTSLPHTTGMYLEKALRSCSDVLTCGPAADEFCLSRWDLMDLLPKVRQQDIPFFSHPYMDLVRGIPPGYRPDFCLFVETGVHYPLAFLELFACPKACYLIDTHLHKESHLALARSFDVIFLAQKAYVEEFSAALGRPVIWLPLAADPEIHKPCHSEESFDIGFCGSITHPSQIRSRRLKRLALRFDVRFKRVFLEEMSAFLGGARVLFNDAVSDDLNMRVFESLAMGKPLLTPDVPGLSDLFSINGKDADLCVYNDETLVPQARLLLERGQDSLSMAARGREKVLFAHTYRHRAKRILSVMEEISREASGIFSGGKRHGSYSDL